MSTFGSPASRNEFSSAKPVGPEHELLVAVLDRAVLDYHSKRTGLSEPAKEWLFDSEDGDEMFSFDWICEHLNLEPEAVRKRVAELKLSTAFAQSHRWLRRKVQSGARAVENEDDTVQVAAA